MYEFIAYFYFYMEEIVTKNAKETRKLGQDLAKKLKGGEVICLKGELGSGKTTFSQGILEGLGAQKPYTSPTFLVMKNYKIDGDIIKNIYHIDTYRVESADIVDLGWDEIIEDSENIIIIEWPERISDIIPKNSINIKFKAINENDRSINIDYN